jgi:hypothetical protein
MTQIKEVRRLALIEAIKDSGVGISEFAERYLARDHGTVYRWLAGTSPVPKVVANWLAHHADDIIGGGVHE